MILQSLTKLAEREGLAEDPSFEIREVHWIINIKSNGRFISLESLLHPIEDSNKKSRLAGKKILIPRQSGRTSGDQAEFLVDKAEYVFGIGDCDNNKLRKRHNLFKANIKTASERTNDSGLRTVLNLLLSRKQIATAKAAVRDRYKNREIESNHLFVFRMEGDNAPFIHLRPKVISYYRGIGPTLFEGDRMGQCLITGQFGPLAQKFPVVKKIPPMAITKGGVHLTAVDNDSFAYHSYGMVGNENSPISFKGAASFVDALNRLLDRDFPDPHDPNIRLPEQRVQLSNDTVAVFWTDTSSRIPAAIVPAIGDGEPEAIKKFGISLGLHESWSEIQGEKEEQISPEPVRRTFRAPWEGEDIKSYELKDTHAFRLLILSGTQGRAIVRAFHSSRICDTVDAVKNWFDDIRISTLKGKPALWRLINSLALRRDRANLSPNLSSRVFLSILNGKELPHEVLETAIRRCRSEPNSRQIGARLIGDQKVTPERAALIKAYLNRQRRRQASPDYISYLEVKPMLNEQERNRGYLLGRMFACVERMQELALGEVGASVTDRFFSGACATPQAVFPRLLKNEIHHHGKAREGKWAGNARWVHGIISQLAAWLVGSENGMQKDETIEKFLKRTVGKPLKGFPAFLPLPEQGLFVLGYHQQRAEFFRPKQKDELSQPA